MTWRDHPADRCENCGLSNWDCWCEETCDHCGMPESDCECVMCGSCSETVHFKDYDADLDLCADCFRSQSFEEGHEGV